MAHRRLPPRRADGRFRKRRNPRRVRRNVDGFIGEDGKFHPIRGSKGYSPLRAGEPPAGVKRRGLARLRARRRAAGLT